MQSRGSARVRRLTSCTDNLSDEFNAASFSGDDGSISWAGSWIEVGESDGATSGDIRVTTDQSAYQLRVRDNDNGGEGVQRVADLSGFSGAALSLDYRRQGLDNSNDYVALYISTTGTSGPWTELDRYAGAATDSGIPVGAVRHLELYFEPNGDPALELVDERRHRHRLLRQHRNPLPELTTAPGFGERDSLSGSAAAKATGRKQGLCVRIVSGLLVSAALRAVADVVTVQRAGRWTERRLAPSPTALTDSRTDYR